jgi:hypothetical protein
MGASNEVNWTASEASLAVTHTAARPERWEIKTILSPSGEYCGFKSKRVEEITFTRRAGSFRTGSSSRQMSTSISRLL